jgi:hypothetical protein
MASLPAPTLQTFSSATGSKHAGSLNPSPVWHRRRDEKRRRIELAGHLANGRILPTDQLTAALEILIAPGDRVVLEGNNQKQADFLSRSLARPIRPACMICT